MSCRGMPSSRGTRWRREQMTQAKEMPVGTRPAGADRPADLLEQYGCGTVEFSGTADGLYERHLVFDDVLAPPAAGSRERFEAFARSVRDVLSQRWVRTEPAYGHENPDR